jgi:hypothetical protein
MVPKVSEFPLVLLTSKYVRWKEGSALESEETVANSPVWLA